MTDASGTVVWAADYKPFGEATITVSTIMNNLRFPGQYFDAETGLDYNYFRDYNPVIGKYIEADSFGILPSGLRGARDGLNHLYAYAGNSPINFTDPFGECPLTYDTGWKYHTNTLYPGTPKRYQVEYGTRYKMTLVDHKGECGQCPMADVVYCKYDIQEGSYQRNRYYDQKTKQYGSWGDWAGGWPFDALLSGVYYAYDCKSKKFVGNLLF